MGRLRVDKHTRFKKTRRTRRQYGFLKAIYLSFFARRLYVDVIRHWRGFGFAYLFVMLSLAVLPYAMHVVVSSKLTLDKSYFDAIKQLPPFSIRQGCVYFYSPMPYLVKNAANEVIAVIDTEGTIKRLPYFLYPKATVLVTKNAWHIKIPMVPFLQHDDFEDTKETISQFDPHENINFVGADWLESMHLDSIGHLLCFALYPVVWMLYFGIYVGVLFAFSLIGQFFAKFLFKVHLTFKQTARVMAVAATPQALIYFMLLAGNKIYPGTGIFYMMLVSVYFSWGVLAYRRDSRAMIVS